MEQTCLLSLSWLVGEDFYIGRQISSLETLCITTELTTLIFRSEQGNIHWEMCTAVSYFLKWALKFCPNQEPFPYDCSQQLWSISYTWKSLQGLSHWFINSPDIGYLTVFTKQTFLEVCEERHRQGNQSHSPKFSVQRTKTIWVNK